MSFPPFPPAGRYSPSKATFPYPLSNTTPTPPFAPFDAYGSERPPFSYDQPTSARPYESDAYDPYQPASTTSYTPVAPPPSSSYQPARPLTSLPRNPVTPVANELSLLTDITSVDIAGEALPVHSLPPSHLPLDKFVAANREDAISVHRQLCRNAYSIWYADGSSRAGEGWSAAIEWIIDSGRSGSKMRGFVGDGDALDAELGGICKAIEGFHELLRLSIKDGKPISHDLIVFSDSPAAIVGIDTSSRPEALRFDKIWREICSEFTQAHLKLAWLPKNTNIEGQVLANKIATVGASNSYLKRRKDNTLPEVYRRPNGGEPAPAGSTEAGPWQRGDADPSRRKSPFERPKPLLEDNAGTVFVTRFPDGASAKDLGILFARFGNILSVDIYHITAQHHRFANVSYSDPESGRTAINTLHHRPIDLGNDSSEDLALWREWQGQLTVVVAEPGRLVPTSATAEFPSLPEWAIGGSRDQREENEVDLQVSEPSPGRKRHTSEPAAPSPKRVRAESQAPVKVEPANSPNPAHVELAHPVPNLPPTPVTGNAGSRRPLTNSASEPQEYPIKVGAKTIRAQIALVQRSFGKVHVSNWIAHSCFVASEIDQARRGLQDDLYATDTGFLTGRDLEKRLSEKGFTPQRMDAFIGKVLKVLDGIAMAEAEENGEGETQDDLTDAEKELEAVLAPFPDQTKEAVASASRLMEYLLRGKEAQEKRRLEVERRVKVLEGMDKKGEHVSGVVRYLLDEEK